MSGGDAPDTMFTLIFQEFIMKVRTQVKAGDGSVYMVIYRPGSSGDARN